jgi:hypothetical protein
MDRHETADHARDPRLLYQTRSTIKEAFGSEMRIRMEKCFIPSPQMPARFITKASQWFMSSSDWL